MSMFGSNITARGGSGPGIGVARGISGPAKVGSVQIERSLVRAIGASQSPGMAVELDLRMVQSSTI
jgi:hypothetical protein